MKHLLRNFHILEILFLSFSLFSCSKDYDVSTPNNLRKFTANSFTNAGLMHNVNLENILLKLKNNNNISTTKSMSSNIMNVTSINITQSSILQNANNISLQQIYDDKNTSPQIKDDMIQFTNAVYNNDPILGSENLYTSNTASKYSNDQLYFINILNTIITDNDESIESLQKRIENLELNIFQSDLTQSQQAALYIITNTAKSSLLYWNQNLNSWTGFFNETNISSISNSVARITSMTVKSNLANKISWKRVAKSDIGGAVAGVASWGGAALLGGPTTLAAFGASVGGWAAGCSAYEAIMQLW